MTTRYFSIDFNDLSFEKQQELITEIKQELLSSYELEGKEFLTRKWHDPVPKTWEEAFIRMSAIDSILWEDYENTKSKADEPAWKTLLEDYAEKQAIDVCSNAIRNIRVEVKI